MSNSVRFECFLDSVTFCLFTGVYPYCPSVRARIYTSIFFLDRCGNILWRPRTTSVGAGFCIFLCLLIRPASHPPLLFVRSIDSMASKRDGKWPQLCGVCSLYFARCHNTHKTSDYENYSLVEEAEMEAGDWPRPSQKETARIRRLASLLLFNHYYTVSGVLMHIGMTLKTYAGSSLLNSSSLFHLCEVITVG